MKQYKLPLTVNKGRRKRAIPYSILRPFLNGSKNHVSQETLNLIMFYHNHRRYMAGKRSGRTPMEILTGKKKKGWIELLFEVVTKKDPYFLLLPNNFL